MKNKKNKVIAILTADIHLSHKPPVWRSNEPNWYFAMQRPLHEIDELQSKYNCPILVAGDICDKWNCCPELINFAMEYMPDKVFAIPGQHDTPEHDKTQMKRSAYYSLMLSGRIRDVEDIEMLAHPLANFNIYPFEHGEKIEPPNRGVTNNRGVKRMTGQPNIALVHDYVWTARSKYPNAPKEKEIRKLNKHMINGKYYGYDVIVYGDNHKGFLAHVGKTTVYNCGTLMRRRSDEEDYKPKVGLLYSDGTVEPYYLDISQDKHLTAEEVKDAEEIEELDMELFAKELRALGASGLDFVDAMKRFWCSDKTRKAVQHIITKAMEK